MTTKRKAVWVMLLVLAVIMLSQLACDGEGGVKLNTTGDVVRDTGQAAVNVGHELVGQAGAGVNAFVNDTVNILTPLSVK